MKKYIWMLPAVMIFTASCGDPQEKKEVVEIVESAMDKVDESYVDPSSMQVTDADGFTWQTEQFADLKMIRYQVPGFEELSADQKKLVYYLTQAGLAGRDMMYDQNYRHNLEIRNTLENVYTTFTGNKNTVGWHAFETYLKRIWFSNGIHHHYSNSKFQPEFDDAYFDEIMAATGQSLSDEARRAIFDADFDAKKVQQNADLGLVEGSAINFYAPDVTTEEAKEYFASIAVKGDKTPVSYGLNSRLVKGEDGTISEEVYRIGGLYSDALTEVVKWLTLAETVAENPKQASALRKLIAYYETGDLLEWDNYNIAWVGATEGDIDYINGFVEVYNDPLGYTGSYENIVQIKDFEASARMQVMKDNAQWFETNSPVAAEHKKDKVTGITYNVVNVVGESGDASPSTPIGVNLPNANWIRLKGSKSVSLGNIVNAYDQAGGTSLLEAFAHDQEEIDRAKAHGELAGKLHTAMHEVIGHASGKLEEGVGTPKETIQEYASTIEEGRADLIALYYLLDDKMVELGLIPSLEVGMAEYDSYIRNGMMLQLRRLEKGEIIEEAHMKNRAWISHWVFEKGAADNVIAKVVKDGKTYLDIQDYQKLRVLFGDLLKEVQRIKSSGDYDAAKALVEGYGVQVDPEIHQEVLDRAAILNSAPYGGFINPVLKPVMTDGVISDIEVTYPDNFTEQMLFYSKNYGHLSK